MGLLVRAATDVDHDTVVLSLDGIGAYDHIHRASMLSKLAALPTASSMLPFVRLFYSGPSRYLWYDDDGLEHEIVQGEGGNRATP